jgi:COMPASS component SWD1
MAEISLGSAHKAEHNIYIWDKNMGNLVKILEGPKEPLDDLTVSSCSIALA